MVLGWPKGLVGEPSIFQRFFWNLKDFWPLFIPIFVFIYLFKEWWQKGKDPKLKKTIIAQYEPPDNLRPAEVSLILNQKIQLRDISATLLDLAVRGFLKIKEIKNPSFFQKTDYTLMKLKEIEGQKENLKKYEKDLLESIFSGGLKGIVVSMLKNQFYPHIQDFIDEVDSEVSNLGYFISNPKEITRKWSSVGTTIIGITMLLSYLLIEFFPNFFLSYLTIFISLFVSGLLFLIFSPFMPKRTEKGTEAYWKILGFREYIDTAEKYRAQFYEKENIFEKYLPYAIIFGLVDKWAKAFEGIYKTSPSWYEGDFGPTFTTGAFISSVSRNISNLNSIFTSWRPGGGGVGGSGLGGGGSSGGGGGGGGGGNW